MAAGRVKRLKDLIDVLDRLPQSPDRDRLLTEVRSRAVDLDTGVTPRAMLPLDEPAPPPVAPKPPQHHRLSSVTLTAHPQRAPAVELALPMFAANPSRDPEQVLWAAERLSLEDSPEFSPLPQPPAHGDRAVAPWTLGLRG
jgi:hypothetical protein